jgi:hypothetical protein
MTSDFHTSFHLSEHDKEHIGEIVAGYGDWFSAELIRLIRKADVQNRARLRTVYPEHVKAVEDWMDHR